MTAGNENILDELADNSLILPIKELNQPYQTKKLTSSWSWIGNECRLVVS